MTLRGDDPRPLCCPVACLPAQKPRARLREVHRGSRQWPRTRAGLHRCPRAPAAPLRGHTGLVWVRLGWVGLLWFGLGWSGLAVGPEPRPPPASRSPVVGRNIREASLTPRPPAARCKGWRGPTVTGWEWTLSTTSRGQRTEGSQTPSLRPWPQVDPTPTRPGIPRRTLAHPGQCGGRPGAHHGRQSGSVPAPASISVLLPTAATQGAGR